MVSDPADKGLWSSQQRIQVKQEGDRQMFEPKRWNHSANTKFARCTPASKTRHLNNKTDSGAPTAAIVRFGTTKKSPCLAEGEEKARSAGACGLY
jgi:hypothetical protein